MRMMAVAGLVGSAAAQCTLPAALPADTQFAAGNPEECVLGKAECAPSAAPYCLVLSCLVLSCLVLLGVCASASVCVGSGLEAGALPVSLCMRAPARCLDGCGHGWTALRPKEMLTE
eukprot:COSAG02_NODE_15253_length_1189_cov_2.739450_1_plen_117_part_00